MQKKKIVHYINTLTDGGAQTQLILLCNNVDLDKYDVYVVCWSKKASIPLRPQINIIEISRGKKYNIPAFLYKIYTTTKLLRPEIVQLWLPEILTLPAAVFAKIIGAKIISMERRLPVTSFGRLYMRDRVKYFVHLLSNMLVTNFPVPLKRKSFFNVIVGLKKHAVIYNALDFKNNKTRHLNNSLANDIFKIVYCGRLVPQKNIDLLVKAFHQVFVKNPNMRLDIYGVGEREAQVTALVAELKLANVVKLNGYQKDWQSLVVGSNCFILPTNREGMPNVLFEAAQIGLPIIATNIEEIACHFTNKFDAILINPNNQNDIVNALTEAIYNPLLLDTIAENAYKTIEKYNVPGMTKRYEGVYDMLIKVNNDVGV